MENNLPNGWARASVSEYSVISKSKGDSEKTPYLEIGDIDIVTKKYELKDKPSVKGCKSSKKNDVVISRVRPTRGAIAVIKEDELLVSSAFSVLRFNEEAQAKSVFYQLAFNPDFLNYLGENCTGTMYPTVSEDIIGKFILNIPPLPEQNRIVSKLDVAFAKTETCRKRLEKIPKLLKRFRQSVLAEAVNGRLSEGSKVKTDVNEEWKQLPLVDCIFELRNGLGKKPNIDPPGIPILRISSVRPGFVDITDFRYYNSKENNIENFYLKNDDLLFTRYNGSIEFLGVCGIVKNINKEFVYPDKLMRVRVNPEILDPNYCEIYFQSEQARNEILKYAKSSAGQNGISGGDLKKVIINLPSLNEQKEIVRKVEHLFALANKLEARYNKAKNLLEKLPQSILTKAFRGELVPQDPNDEPAEELLARIREEKERLKDEGKKRIEKVKNKRAQEKKSNRLQPSVA